VISINILYFDLRHGEDYVYHGKTQFRGIHYHDELQLNNKQQALFGKQYPHDTLSKGLARAKEILDIRHLGEEER